MLFQVQISIFFSYSDLLHVIQIIKMLSYLPIIINAHIDCKPFLANKNICRAVDLCLAKSCSIS